MNTSFLTFTDPTLKNVLLTQLDLGAKIGMLFL